MTSDETRRFVVPQDAGLPDGAALEARLTRLRQLLSEQGADAAILTSAPAKRYFAGFRGSTAWVLVTADAQTIHVDSRYTLQAQGECPGYDVRTSPRPLSALMAQLNEGSAQAIALEDRDLDWATLRVLEAGLTELTPRFIPLGETLAALREVKDASELAALRRAVEIADEAWAAVLPHMQVGVTEQAIAARLEFEMRLRGADAAAFDTIIASGWRSALPHGVASEKALEVGDAVVMDFGARYRDYHSDMTRTVFVAEVPPKLREIYDIVLEAQLACEAASAAASPAARAIAWRARSSSATATARPSGTARATASASRSMSRRASPRASRAPCRSGR